MRAAFRKRPAMGVQVHESRAGIEGSSLLPGVTEGGISYRRIKLRFGLDDDAVEELRCELIGG
jgi:hypothetical protein